MFIGARFHADMSERVLQLVKRGKDESERADCDKTRRGIKTVFKAE